MNEIDVDLHEKGRTLRLPEPTTRSGGNQRIFVGLTWWYEDGVFPPRITLTIRQESGWGCETTLRLKSNGARVLGQALIELADAAELRPEEPEDPARSDRLHALAEIDARE